MKSKTVKKVKNTFLNVITGILLIIILLPAVWIILSSFRPLQEIMAKPAVWIPTELNTESYTMIFSGSRHGMKSVPVKDYFRNSIVISVTSTIFAVGIGMLGGYAFSRFKFKRKNTLFPLIMLSRTVPGIALSL